MAFRHVGVAVLIALIFGLNASVVKIGVRDISPLMYTAWRYIIILPLLLAVPFPKISLRAFLAISLATGGCTALASLILALGVGAGLSNVMLQTQVFFTAFLSMALGGDRPTPRGWAGMTLAFMGVACIALRMGNQISYLGFFLTLAGAVCWAVTNILLQHLRHLNMVHLTIWASAALPLPLLALSGVFYGWETLLENPFHSKTATVSLLYSGLISGLTGSVLTGLLLKHYAATLVAPIMLLIPVSALLFAYFILGETLSIQSAVGCGLVLAGLCVNQWGEKKKAEQAVPPLELP